MVKSDIERILDYETDLWLAYCELHYQTMMEGTMKEEQGKEFEELGARRHALGFGGFEKGKERR